MEVKSRGRREPEQVFEEKPELEWEVDGFWKLFREKALPNIKSGSRVSVELRVSESPELRRELEAQIRKEIEKAGAAARRRHGFFRLQARTVMARGPRRTCNPRESRSPSSR